MSGLTRKEVEIKVCKLLISLLFSNLYGLMITNITLPKKSAILFKTLVFKIPVTQCHKYFNKIQINIKLKQRQLMFHSFTFRSIS